MTVLQDQTLFVQSTVKFPKFGTQENFAVIILKLKKRGFTMIEYQSYYYRFRGETRRFFATKRREISSLSRCSTTKKTIYCLPFSPRSGKFGGFSLRELRPQSRHPSPGILILYCLQVIFIVFEWYTQCQHHIKLLSNKDLPFYDMFNNLFFVQE